MCNNSKALTAGYLGAPDYHAMQYVIARTFFRSRFIALVDRSVSTTVG